MHDMRGELISYIFIAKHVSARGNYINFCGMFYSTSSVSINLFARN